MSPEMRAKLRHHLWWIREGQQELERFRFLVQRPRNGVRPWDGKRPNVVLFSVDSMSARHLGCYGYPRPTSPNIDSLARSGVVFERVFTQANWTKPALSSMLTGLTPSVHRTDSRGEAGDRVNVGDRKQANILAEEFRTIAQEFKAAGYATTGLSNGGYAHSFFGFGRGFDHYDNYAGGSKSCLYRLLRWIVAHRDQPFFAFVHVWDAHYPYLDRPPFNRMYVERPANIVLDTETRVEINSGKRKLEPFEVEYLRARFDGSINYVDQQFGAFVRELERMHLLDRTYLAVTADHGEAFMEHGVVEHTECMYNEVLNVPFVLRGPGMEAKRIASQARTVDMMPTLLDLAGLKPSQPIQGTSLLPWIRGERSDDLVAVSETERGGGQTMISDGKFKLIRKRGEDRVELYDLVNDALETKDLSRKRFDVKARLENMLTVWEGETQQCHQSYATASVHSESMNAEVLRRLQDLGYLE